MTNVADHRARLEGGYPPWWAKPACHVCGCRVKALLGLDVVTGKFVCAKRVGVTHGYGADAFGVLMPVDRHLVENAAKREGSRVDLQLQRLAEVV